MGTVHATSESKSVTVEAVVIRADGTREDLGVIARWHRNPFRRLLWRLQDAVRRR
jgi:hypothetical protein